MNELKYQIDNKPVSAEDIIKLARELDDDYNKSGFYQTSIAAKILRENGHAVENNPSFRSNK